LEQPARDWHLDGTRWYGTARQNRHRDIVANAFLLGSCATDEVNEQLKHSQDAPAVPLPIPPDEIYRLVYDFSWWRRAEAAEPEILGA
jgi:hypothetical protein